MTLETKTKYEDQEYFLSAPDADIMERAFSQMRDNGVLDLRFPGEVLKVIVDDSEKPIARLSIDTPDGEYVPHLGFYVMPTHKFDVYEELQRTRDFLLDECDLDDNAVPHYRIAIGARVLDDRGSRIDASFDVLLGKLDHKSPRDIASRLPCAHERDPLGFQAYRILESLYLNFGVLANSGERDMALIRDRSTTLMSMLEKFKDSSEPEKYTIYDAPTCLFVPDMLKRLFIDRADEIKGMVDEFLPYAHIKGSEDAFMRHFDIYGLDISYRKDIA